MSDSKPTTRKERAAWRACAEDTANGIYQNARLNKQAVCRLIADVERAHEALNHLLDDYFLTYAALSPQVWCAFEKRDIVIAARAILDETDGPS